MASANTDTTPIRPPGGPTALFLPHLDVLAHTGRCLLVAGELRRRGRRALFAGAGRYERLVREAGFQCAQLPEMPAGDLVRESRRGKRWPFHSPDQIRPFVAAELEIYKEVRPDIVVFDHRYTAGISAEIAQLPRVSITNLWWTPYDATGMGLAETHPLLVSLPALRFIRAFGWANPLGNALARAMFRRWIRPYNTVRAEHGLGPLDSILDLFTGDAVILPDTPQLTPAEGLPDNHHYVGPLVWEPAGGVPAELEDLGNFVYATMGSSADPAVFEVVVDALSLLTDTPAVVTTGGVRRPEEFDSAGGRLRFYDFLPGSAAARRASLVVCQGGIGTIYQALAAGKPVIGIPFMPEQEVYGIGAVERLGAGLSVSARKLTPAKLAAAIRRVLADPSFSKAAERISATIDLKSGPSRAADVISSIAS